MPKTVSSTGKKKQIEVFPQRLLNMDSAQKLLNELNEIDGIRRMVVHGPRLPKDDPADLLEGKYNASETRYLNIMGEQVPLSVQVGRVWIEIDSPGVVEKVREACEKALPMPFEINEGKYIRTAKSMTDYARKGGKVADVDIGMFDPKAKPASSCCRLSEPE